MKYVGMALILVPISIFTTAVLAGITEDPLLGLFILCIISAGMGRELLNDQH